MRIGIRLFFGFFLIAGLALFVVLRVFLEEVKPGTRQAMEDSLIDAAYAFSELAAPDMRRGTIASGEFAKAMARYEKAKPQANISGFEKREMEYRITITDAQGTVVFDTLGEAVGQDFSRWNDVLKTLRGQYGARSTLGNPKDPNSSIMHVAAPIMDRVDGEPARTLGVLTVSKPTRTLMPSIERSQARILRWSWWLLGGCLAIGLVFIWWIARSLARLQNYAQDVAQNKRATMPQFGHLSGNTEFGDLAQALETMRLRLEDKAYVDTYVHTLTHEMKSPLAAIGGAAELLQDDLPAADRARFSRNIAQQTQALRTLIDRLLTLAQLEQTPQLSHPVALNLTALVHGRIHALEPHWHQKDLSMVFDCEVAHWLVGDAFWLGQAIDNLLENAIDFSPPGACIHTTLTATAQQLALRVQDAGVGMPDYAVDKVFDRFYSLPRPDTAQKSSGLGLCLVREVAQLHGGTITLHNNPVSGTTATLILPKKPS